MASDNVLTKEDVEKVAALAKLQLTQEQLTRFQSQLASVMEYMDLLNEQDTSSTPPTSQVTGLHNIFRDDVAQSSMKQETLLSLAPETENGYVKVRAVFEETE